MKSTKKSLIASALSLVLCVSMLLGTTYAWFTDSVTSGKNRIVAGNLKVDLVMDKAADGNYVSIANEEGAIFGEGSIAQNNSAETLWEPGKTQIVYLGVKNAGTLALKYNMLIDVKDEGLIGALEYAFIDGAKAADLSAAEKWSDITSADGVEVADVVAGRTKAAQNGVLDEIAKGTVDETDYFALAVHMKEDAGNEYKDKGITIDVTVMATQVEAENDSFDNTYDKDVEFQTLAGNYPPLEEVLRSLGDDDEIPEQILVKTPVEINAVMTDEYGESYGDDTDHELKLKSSTTIHLENTITSGNYMSGETWGNLRIETGATLTMDANENGKWINTASNSIFDIEGGSLVINGGTYESVAAIINMYSDTPACELPVQINGGTFKADGIVTNGHTGARNVNEVIFNPYGYKVEINGGTFYNWNPSAYVTEGHTVTPTTSGSDTIYTVS